MTTELPEDLPFHARERLTEMKARGLFSSDLTVSELLLIKECGFEPLGLVMGSSIYRIQPTQPSSSVVTEELTTLTQALYHARELAMTRIEEEAEALGADGIVGVRLTVNLHAWGKQIMEFMAIGTAVRNVKHEGAERFHNKHGKPFTSDLSGQDFWTLLHSGWRPVGLVMGNCAFYVGLDAAAGYLGNPDNAELVEFTHAMYDAREEAMERLQAEAEELEAEGVVGVTVCHQEHAWRGWLGGNPRKFKGELLEFFVIGTAVVKQENPEPISRPRLFIRADGGGER